ADQGGRHPRPRRHPLRDPLLPRPLRGLERARRDPRRARPQARRTVAAARCRSDRGSPGATAAAGPRGARAALPPLPRGRPGAPAESFHAAVARGQEALAFDAQHEGAKATLVALFLDKLANAELREDKADAVLFAGLARRLGAGDAVTARGHLRVETEPRGAR